ncbi:MAG: tripartite tricarboxylate transporter substrate binding protein [Hyphomicrobiales bacterium]|nr:tripartite tricarboxylate transporter substrate binding protein [Hyphomicrobiales bacterium]
MIRVEKHSILAIGFMLAALGASGAFSQNHPSKPIKIVVPYSPGGPGDFSFRTVAKTLEQRSGWRFVIENKPGASGNIGAAEVARAAPDGYTFLLGATNNFVSNQFLYKTMGFDPLIAFMPVALISNSPTVFTANSAQPFKTLPELVAFANSNPGKLNYGSPGLATPPHLAGELLSRLAGIEMQHVPFRGAGDVIPSMLGNNIQLYFATLPSVLGNVRSGDFRALAVGAPVRLEAIADVPTVGEVGYPDAIAGNWWLLAAPRGTDTKLVERLSSDIRKALSDPMVKRRFLEFGMLADAQTPDELQIMLRSEAARWQKIIAAAGIAFQ